MRRGEEESPPGGGNPLPPVEPPSATASSGIVLVTDPTLIGGLEGIVRRGGKMVGLRYGTVGYDFAGRELPLLGGLDAGATCLGRIELSKNHPTNPFRHKYHHDHRSGYDLVRQFMIEFDGVEGTPLPELPEYALNRLTGTYHETIVGLHKIPLKMEGRFTLNRISLVKELNATQ